MDPEEIIARTIDDVCFEHPDIPGAHMRRLSAIRKAKEVVEKLRKAGFEISEIKQPDVNAMMVEGYGVI